MLSLPYDFGGDSLSHGRAATSIDAVTRALANIREVYGIHRLTFDRAARTLRVEYDATRLNAAAVAKLVRQAGLEIEADLPLTAPTAGLGAGARSLAFSIAPPEKP